MIVTFWKKKSLAMQAVRLVSDHSCVLQIHLICCFIQGKLSGASSDEVSPVRKSKKGKGKEKDKKKKKKEKTPKKSKRHKSSEPEDDDEEIDEEEDDEEDEDDVGRGRKRKKRDRFGGFILEEAEVDDEVEDEEEWEEGAENYGLVGNEIDEGGPTAREIEGRRRQQAMWE